MRNVVALTFFALALTAFLPAARALPGCEVSDQTGCGGCACEACVCAMDDYCCSIEWDSICVDECLTACGGCIEYANCGDGTCDPAELENCEYCPEDCACDEGESCFEEACCVPSCEGVVCGDDGCGGTCGDCAPGEYCTEAGACEPIPPCDVIQALHCDDVIEIDNTNGTSIIGEYDCVGWDESGPELGFSFDSGIEDLVVFTVETTGDADLDIFLMESSCTPDACLDYGGSEITSEVAAGSHYFLTVDGYGGDTGPGILKVWCQSTCEPTCEAGFCGADGCLGTCPCTGEGEVCFEDACCVPDCTDKECGDDGCGGDCGDCAEGMACKDFTCMLPTCEGSCGGSSDLGCWCDESCFGFGDCCDDICDWCAWMGDCLDLTNCNDNNCDATAGETCETCPDDCPCAEGDKCFLHACCTPTCDEDNACQDDGCGGICPCASDDDVCFEGACCTPTCSADTACQSDGCGGTCPCIDEGNVCYNGSCCTPSCDGKECGSDGCGGSCGECGGSLYCNDQGTCQEPSCEGNCGGSAMYCYCDEVCFDYGDCCNDVCEFCPEMDASGQICADLTNCGNGSCDAGAGENCSNCADDCTCPTGEACGVVNGAPGCLQDMCAEGATDIGCCYDGVLFACDEGINYSLDCEGQDSICGWYEGDFQYPPGFYCGPDDLILPDGDPSGEYEMECVLCDPACGPGEKCVQGECIDCVADCAGKNCGPDGCGGFCGQCAEGLNCTNGWCTLPPVVGCEPLDGPGCGGCPCEDCVCGMDSYCCNTQWDDICAGECLDSCGGCPEPDPFCGDTACNGDENCETCAEDCGCPPNQFCAAGECVACQPGCDGMACGDDGCGGSCGDCDEGFDCVAGQCQEPCDSDCTGLNCGDDGCGGSCGECAGDESCVDGVCQIVDPCGNGVLDDGEQCEADADCGTSAVCEDCLCVIACVPVCDGKQCGDDGCDGSCGTCDDGQTCDDNGQCIGGAGPDVVADLATSDGVPGGGDSLGEDVSEGGSDGKKSGGCSATDSSGAGALLLLVVLLSLATLRTRRRQAA